MMSDLEKVSLAFDILNDADIVEEFEDMDGESYE